MIRLIDAGNQIKQRALAGTRWPHQRGEFAALNIERDIGQHRHGVPAAVIRFGEIAYLDDRWCNPCYDFGWRVQNSGAYFAATATATPSRSRSDGLMTTLSPGFKPCLTSSASPYDAPV